MAVAFGAGVLVVLARPRSILWPWLGVELLGLGVVTAGAMAVQKGYRPPGIAIGVAGATLCLLAIGGFLARPAATSELVRLTPGFLGIAGVTAAVIPVRNGGSRALVKAGSGALFACVLLTGLFQAGTPTRLLVAGVGTVIVWDLGENAIGIGQQLGRRARTWRLELTHLGGTTLVGVAGVATVLFLRVFAAGGLSLASFGMAFVALVLLTLGIRW